MIVGVGLVVDELHKGQRLVFRYPESVPSAALNSNTADGKSLLQFHKEYLSLSAENMAKLFRPKSSLCNSILELLVDDLHFISFPCTCIDEGSLPTASAAPTGGATATSSLATTTGNMAASSDGSAAGADHKDETITFFNVVVAKVRDSAMERIKGRVYTHDIPTGVDPVAAALGLQAGHYFQQIAPADVRRGVELFSRALLHEERRVKYVSRQVGLMLSITAGGGGAAGPVVAEEEEYRVERKDSVDEEEGEEGEEGDEEGEDGEEGDEGEKAGEGGQDGQKERVDAEGGESLGAAADEAGEAPALSKLALAAPSSAAASAAAAAAVSPLSERQQRQHSASTTSNISSSSSHTFDRQPSTGSNSTNDDDTPFAPKAPSPTHAHAPLPQTSEEILQRSSLANELRCLYHGLAAANCVSVRVNQAISVHVKLRVRGAWRGRQRAERRGDDDVGSGSPTPRGTPRRPSSPHAAAHADPAPAFRLSSTAPRSPPPAPSAALDETPWESWQPAADDTLLTICEPEDMLVLFGLGLEQEGRIDEGAGAGAGAGAAENRWQSCSPQLLALLPALIPTQTLAEIAAHLELPVEEVHVMATQLCSWGLADLITVITAESRFQVHPQAPLARDCRTSRAFAAAFLGGTRDVEEEGEMIARASELQARRREDERRARASDRTGLADRGGGGGGGGGSHAAAAPAPMLRCSLPVVLSVFDGERTLGQAIRLLSRSLQPFGIDIVVWLLRRKLLMLSDCD